MTGHSTDERAAPTTSPVRSIRRSAVTRKGSRQLVVVAPPARPMPGVRPATSRLSRRFGSTMRRRWWIDVFFVNPHPLLKVERDTLRFPAGTTLGNLRQNTNLSFLSGRPEGTGGGCTWAAATAAAGVGPPATASTLASNTLAPRRRAGWGRLRRPFRLLGPRRPFRLLVAQGTMAVEREVVRRAR